MSARPITENLLAAPVFEAYCRELARWLDEGSGEAALRSSSEVICADARRRSLAPEQILIALGTTTCRQSVTPAQSDSDRASIERERRYTYAVGVLLTAYFAATGPRPPSRSSMAPTLVRALRQDTSGEMTLPTHVMSRAQP